MPTWNSQQLKAIETKQKNILISASAGAGKTTVLIARLVDLVIKDRIRIEQILAMTFTEAAANEMKKRLAIELHILYSQVQDSEEKAYISEQLSAIATAHISTIHSFCLSIIQEFYYVIGLDARRISNIMDNGAMSRYQAQAMQEVFTHQYEQMDEAFYQITTYFSARVENDDALMSAIASLATSANAQSDPESWLTTCLQHYQTYSSINDIPTPIRILFFDDLHVQVQIYKEALEAIDQLYTLKYPSESKKIAVIEQKKKGFPALSQSLQLQDYATFRDAFIAICKILVPTTPDKEDVQYARLRKQINALEDAMIARLFDEQTLLQDIANLRPLVHKLIEMCRDYRSSYARIKEEQACIDFDDMEHFALAILQANNQQVAQHYRETFAEIMVDEFQDSNDVQNDLVKLICRENNVFRVGDIKQSIYGFRHAKPSLMRGLIEHRSLHDEIIYLSNNYRSKKMIVDFNNELYKELMNLDGFEGSYAKEDDVETGIPAQEEDNYPIVFHAIDYPRIKEERQFFLSKNDLKASYIANQIITIKDREQRHWKDFVVLVRSNARKDDMKAAFDTLHIPYFIDIKYGFYQSNAVQIMLSTLKACINPHDDLSFVACMISPLFCMTTQTFADIKLVKESNVSFYAYLQQHPNEAMNSFEACHKQIYSLSISNMLNILYAIQNYYQEQTTMQERTNLDLLFEKAVQFEEQEAKNIPAFVNAIENIKDAQTAEAIPIGSDEDVVRVMSIHQSKGLQFPVVFLWSNSKQTPIEFKELFIQDADLGIGLKAMDIENRFVRPTLFRYAMEHKKDREELEEEMRILYVATTRAQQQMHIVDCIPELSVYEQPLSMSRVYQRGGYTAWILHTYLQKNSNLFNVKPVSSYWVNKFQAQEQQRFINLPTYVGNVISIESTNASKQKPKDVSTLSFTSSEGATRGTQLHEIIANLPDTLWTKEELLSIDESLQPWDIQALLSLSTNACYRNACTYPQVYHELPYMVQDHVTILHGFIDFVAISDTDIILIDFKSDAVSEAQTLINLYQEQIFTYKKALQILYPDKELYAYMYSFALKKEIRV